jgi:hypothetical protein
MSNGALEARLHTLELFANGTHPIIQAAFWDTQPQPIEKVPLLPHRQPQISFPEIYTPRRLEGDTMTEQLIDAHLPTGEAIYIHDGFTAKIYTNIGPVIVLVDTKCDPLLAGIINKAQTLFQENSTWDTSRRLFEIGLLCFGDWGQKRYPLDAFKQKDTIPQFVLGERVWTTDVLDLECTSLSMVMQAVAQQCDMNIHWHMGYAARFSTYCHGAGPHAWNIIEDGGTLVMIDWTNYPPQIAQLFAAAGTSNKDMVYDQFRKTYGFPKFTQESYPPTQDQYDQLQNGDNPMLATRERVAYWNDLGDYLGSCSIPIEWSNLN